MENEISVTVQCVFKHPGEGDHYFVILKAKSPKLRMPMFIGQNEAHMISYAQNTLPRERPLTIDLFANTVAATGYVVTKILITKGLEQLYYATITIRKDDALIEVDACPSDAIALALTTGATIFVSKQTLVEQGSSN